MENTGLMKEHIATQEEIINPMNYINSFIMPWYFTSIYFYAVPIL